MRNIKVILLLILGMLLPVVARAQTDPLNVAYLPAINTTCAAAAYNANIWLSDWTIKLRQDSGTTPTCTNGMTGNGAKWITVYGTQNEFVDFQVHLHDTGAGTANLTVTASNFVKSTGPGGNFTISAATGVGEDIIAYREVYFNVSKVTATSTAYFNATGVYPDILVPPVDPYWGQTTNAWPFTVAAGKNQSAWIDIQIPPTAPSGYYLGSVTVQSGASTLATMPVILAVWQWPAAQGSQMPSTPTLRTEISEFGDNSICNSAYAPGTNTVPDCTPYQDSGGNSDGGNTQTKADGAMMFKDHRWHNGGRQNVYPGTGSFATYVAQIGPLMNGTCRHSGAFCPLLAGSKNTTMQMGGAVGFSSAEMLNWATNYNSNGWEAYPPSGTPTSTNPVTRLFVYTSDEPAANCTNWNLGAPRHAYATPAYMAELVTGTYTQAAACSALQNVDILVANLKLTQSPLNPTIEPQQPYFDWLAGTNPTNPHGQPREYWSYQACDQTGTCGNGSTGNSTWTMPNVNVDGTPLANRAEEWMTFLHKQTGELYYSPDYCMIPSNMGNCGIPQSNDTWKNNLVFGGSGEGALLYVGQGTNAAATNYVGAGVVNAKPLIMPSLRLKIWRDAVQDYEYLNALTIAGQGTYANTQLSNWITDSFHFEMTGSGLNTARTNLGNTLHAISFPANPLPAAPTALTISVY